MSKKNNIFSRLNLNTKNFDVELEEILDKKNFSEDVQSLILSMFYKIENAYDDYYIVKREMPTKEIFIQTIIDTIKKYCKNIEIMKTKGTKNEKIYKVDLENGELKCKQNEDVLLLGIFELIKIKDKTDDLVDLAISDMLSYGNSLNYQEVIRAFNGWSWQDTLNTPNDIYINLVYQNLLILLGDKKLKEITINSQKVSTIKKVLNELYTSELVEEMTNYIIQFFVSLKVNCSKSYKSEIVHYFEPLSEELRKLENKEQLINYIASKRKEITKKVGDIDKKVNNIDFLKQDFEARNKKLKQDKRIFSISNLVDIYEEEREKLLNSMKEYNKLIEPNFYLYKKEELTNKVEIYNKLNLQSEKKMNIEKIIVGLQEIFLKFFEEKINKCENKKEIIDLIYNYRYYINLNYKKNYKIKDCTKIKSKLNDILLILINKAEKMKAIDVFSNNKESNMEILKNAFTSEFINLENEILQINIIDEKNKLYNVQYYDGTMLIKELELKLKSVLNKKKKLRVFI